MTPEEREDAYWETYFALAGNGENRWTGLCESQGPPDSVYSGVRWICTLPKGHSGRHIGHYANNSVCGRWE